MRWILYIVILILMSACGGVSERITDETTVSDRTIIAFAPPADIEAQITDSIAQIEMEDADRIKIRDHRSAIAYEILFLQDSFVTGNGEIPFTTYKEGLKRIKWNWLPIRTAMDAWSVAGDLTETASGYWYFIRADTERLMKNIDRVVKAKEGEISDKAMDEYMSYFNEAVQIIRPLVGI